MQEEQQYINYLAHMLDEAMDNKCFICEDKEGKNINRAEKWIKDNHPEVIGQKLQNGTTITPRILTQEIRNAIPNVRMVDCKFLVGITRLYFENQDKRDEIQSIFSSLNKMLKIICIAHADEYDNNLNGLSFDELDKKFSGAVQHELDSDKEEIGKLQLIKNQVYKIVPINSFEEAKKYGKYTSWCVTHYEDMFDSYTKGGLGRFYFCLKPGFEKVQTVKGKDCPLDEYGKSMIAISVNDDGSLNTCTCRWNHDNGGNDNMMNMKEISQFFGVNSYDTFQPYSANQLLQKYEKSRIEDDEVCKALGAIKIQDDDNQIFYVSVRDNKIVKRQSAGDNCLLKNGKFWHAENGKLFEGAPQEVGENFWCNGNQLTSLEGAPQKVGGDFRCNGNKLTSLEGAPLKVGENFGCQHNQLTSLEGAPQEVGGSFWCNGNKLTSLEGAPQEVGGSFWCQHNQLTSLEGAPLKVGGNFWCDGNQLTREQIEAYKKFLKHPTPAHIDATGHYKP